MVIVRENRASTAFAIIITVFGKRLLKCPFDDTLAEWLRPRERAAELSPL
jgi:hypothetical protein